MEEKLESRKKVSKELQEFINSIATIGKSRKWQIKTVSWKS